MNAMNIAFVINTLITMIKILIYSLQHILNGNTNGEKYSKVEYEKMHAYNAD
jgi:hypothetical protein